MDAADPPLRLTLGEEAVAAVRDKVAAQGRDLDEWEEVSAATAYAG